MKPQTHILLTRRAILAGLLSSPAIALAHGGHGPARISAEARVVRVKDGVVTLVLSFVNTASTPVDLYSVTAEGAAPVVLDTPFQIAGFGTGDIKLDLIFQGAVPGIFTATLDFGDHGKGPVTVMP